MSALPDKYREICRVSFGSIVQDRESGLVRIYPERGQDQMSAVHTTQDYFSHPYFTARRKLSDEAVRAKHAGVLSFICGEGLCRGKSLLDVGCDTGAFLVTARDVFDLDVTGLEISPYSAKVAQTKNGLHVVVGDALSADLPEAAYDYITLIDVIEHVADPVAVLRKLARLLRPGGRIYIVTPNHDALIYGIGRMLYNVFGKFALPLVEKVYIPYHEYYFTPETFSQVAQKAGLKVEKLKISEFPLDEFGHGKFLMLCLLPVFFVQKILKKQSLQEILLVKG